MVKKLQKIFVPSELKAQKQLVFLFYSILGGGGGLTSDPKMENSICFLSPTHIKLYFHINQLMVHPVLHIVLIMAEAKQLSTKISYHCSKLKQNHLFSLCIWAEKIYWELPPWISKLPQSPTSPCVVELRCVLLCGKARKASPL